MLFTISTKAKVVFGEHASDKTGKETKALGCSSVLCVYDKGVKDAGIVSPIVKNLEAEGLTVVQYGGVLADPPDTMVNECAGLARKEGVDGIVGVGGGSTLDTAKGVNVLLGNSGKITDYYYRPDAPPLKPGRPLVLVPTTAGTASEVTHVAVISNTATGLKGGIIGPPTVASVAVVDPLLTLAMPPRLTAATGMDTFAHALEAYTGMPNIMSDLLAEKAMELVIQNLPKAIKNGSDIEARTNMSFACLLAGMAFTDAKVHFGHAFGHSLGAFHHVPHGIGCAIAQPGVIEIVSNLMPKKVSRIGELMGLKLSDHLSLAELVKQVAERIVTFNREVGIPTLKELNIKESDLVPLAEAITKDVCFMFTPVKLDVQDVQRIVKKAYTCSW
jgi:alcohol dehydrogenase